MFLQNTQRSETRSGFIHDCVSVLLSGLTPGWLNAATPGFIPGCVSVVSSHIIPCCASEPAVRLGVHI
jgi:hypothetical protein